MADDEVRPSSEPPRPGPATPNRGKPREAPLIEGQAEEPAADWSGTSTGPASGTPAVDGSDDMSVREPSMAGGAADLASPDRPAEAFAAAAAEAPAARRSMMPVLLGGIGLILILLLGANLYTMYFPPGADALGEVRAKADALDRRVSGLESRPQASVDLAPIETRLKAVETQAAQLKTDVGDTSQKVDALGGQPAAPSGQSDQAGPLQAKVADLAQGLSSLQEAVAALPKADLAPMDAKIGDLDRSVTALKGAVAALPKVDLAPLDARITAVETGLAAVQSMVAALPKVDLAPLDAKIAGLGQRLAPVEAALSAPKVATQVTEARQQGSAAESRAAPLAVTAQAVLQAIDDGRPFATEVAGLQSLGTDEAKLGPLKAVAAKGAPTKAELVSGFAALRNKLVSVAAPPPTGTVLDRMLASAQGFVKVRPAGASPGSDPDAVASRIDAGLNAGSFRAALDEWLQLPDVSKTASADWADRLKARVAAEEAARSIASGAIAALIPTQ